MISIVVPARNEEDVIGGLLQSIEENAFDDYEVIVVDGDSSDRTVEIAERYGAEVISGPLRGTSAARNAGWKAVKGNYIYFLDADSRLPEDALQKISEAAESKPDLIGTNLDTVSDSFVGKVVEQELAIQFENTYFGRFFEKVINLLT